MKKIRPKKKLGQNFLIDKNTCEKIVSAIDTDTNREVLEIGPGTGAITGLLCKASKKVTAVEIDSSLCDILKRKNYENLDIINKDFLRSDIDSFKESIIVGNLPYYITTPIIFKILKSKMSWDKLYFLMQREVAERITALPGTKMYGRLSVTCQALAKTNKIFNVSPNVFRPIPKVDSTFIMLESNPLIRQKEHYLKFEKIIRLIFNKRRKKLKNCISEDMDLNIDPDSPLLNLRPEQISVDEYIKIINY